VAKANEAAAKANERAAELKIALEKEVSLRQPRNLNPTQRAQIIADLAVAPKGKVYVIGSFFDAESTQFANQIADILKAAGFEISEMSARPNRPIGYTAPGVWLWGTRSP